MFRQWQLQEAKAKFSEMVKQAISEGPQMITVHGEQTAIILSMAEFNRLTKRASSFVKFMRESPLKGVKLDLERDKSPGRQDPEL